MRDSDDIEGSGYIGSQLAFNVFGCGVGGVTGAQDSSTLISANTLTLSGEGLTLSSEYLTLT